MENCPDMPLCSQKVRCQFWLFATQSVSAHSSTLEILLKLLSDTTITNTQFLGFGKTFKLQTSFQTWCKGGLYRAEFSRWVRVTKFIIKDSHLTHLALRIKNWVNGHQRENVPVAWVTACAKHDVSVCLMLIISAKGHHCRRSSGQCPVRLV